jgi:hypothetical protein
LKEPTSNFLLVTANVSSSLILFGLMMDAILSSEMLVLTIAAQRNIPEEGILHSHRRETLKSSLVVFARMFLWPTKGRKLFVSFIRDLSRRQPENHIRLQYAFKTYFHSRFC